MACEVPEISVVLAVHNGQDHLREAVESLLQQTFSNFELILINDGSTDQSEAILQQYADKDARIRLVSRENKGLTRSLNEGLRLARGQWIARMDADDVACPQRLAAQHELVLQDPGIVVCGCQVEAINASGQPLDRPMPYPIGNVELKCTLLTGNPIPHPGALMRRDSCLTVGGYDETIRYAQDYDLWWRLLGLGRFANHEQVLLKYRWHEQSISQSKAAEQAATAASLTRAALVRWGLASEEGARRVVAVIRGERELRFSDVQPFVRAHERLLRFLGQRDGAQSSELHDYRCHWGRSWMRRAAGRSRQAAGPWLAAATLLLGQPRNWPMLALRASRRVFGRKSRKQAP